MASRGKMVGVTFEQMAKDGAPHEHSSLQLPVPFLPVSLPSHQSSRGSTTVTPRCSLTDPLLQDVDPASRKYLFYCELSLPSCSVSDVN